MHTHTCIQAYTPYIQETYADKHAHIHTGIHTYIHAYTQADSHTGRSIIHTGTHRQAGLHTSGIHTYIHTYR